MARDLQEDGAPQRAPQTRRRVLRAPLKITSLVKLWIVSHEVQPVHMHWTSKRNAICRIDRHEATCQGCADQLPRRLEYWLTVQHIAIDRPPLLLRLTPGAVRGAPQLLSRGGMLHGHGLAVWRLPPTALGWMFARVHEVQAPKVLWDAPGTWETLLAMDDAQVRAEYRPEPRLYAPPDEVDPLTSGL